MQKNQVTDYPYIEITVRAYNTRDTGKGGLLSFAWASTDVTDDDKNNLGFIAGGGGVVLVSITRGPYFQILHKDIWNAIQEAMEAQNAGDK